MPSFIRLHFLLIFAVVSELAAGLAAAQAGGRITGRVTDAAGVPLPGVTVSLDGLATRHVVTDPDGQFDFAVLPPGRYEIRAELIGFAPSRAALELEPNETAAVPLTLLARFRLPLVQVPPRGLWRQTSRTTNTTLEAWTGRRPVAYPLEEVVLRYLRAFGPASTSDVRTWSWLTGLREVIDPLRPRLRVYRDERGRELLDVEDGLIADPDLPAPVRFLPQYDNVFLSHDDRSRINGSLTWGLEFGWKGAILIDGGINAAWRIRRDRKRATMTIELGRPLTPAERAELKAEAERLARFLDPEAPAERVIVEAG